MSEFKSFFGQRIGGTIHRLIEQKNWKLLKQELSELDPVEIADIIESQPKEERVVVFRLLAREQARETFKHLSHDDREQVIEGMAENRSKLVGLLNDLDPDDRTDFFEELPGEMSQKLMQMLSREEHEIASRLLGYPEQSIGRLMTPEYVAIRPTDSVAQALETIRKFGRDSETLDVIYVVDEEQKLVDDIRIKEIILADPKQAIGEMIDGRFVALNAYDDQEVAVRIFSDHDRTALPVTGKDGTLVGIVTVDDVIDIAEEETTEDFQKFGGTEGLDLSYTRTPVIELVKKRAGWLIVLFLAEMITASMLGRFYGEISQVLLLVLFVPLILSSGGNSGSQAAGLMIRALALDEIAPKNWWVVMRKELLSGLLLGAVLGAIGFARIWIWQIGGFYDYGEHWIWLAASLSVSLVLIVLWGTLIGSLIPLWLKKINLDPAAASAPFVSTLVDVTGLVIYFSVAAIFLAGKLL